MEEMMKRAKEKGLFFYSRYQGLWFSPEELENKQKEGLFRWGAVNWQLRDPNEKVNELIENIKYAELELKKFIEKYNIT